MSDSHEEAVDPEALPPAHPATRMPVKAIESKAELIERIKALPTTSYTPVGELVDALNASNPTVWPDSGYERKDVQK